MVYESEENDNMAECCWYSDDTCCNAMIGSVLLPEFTRIKDTFASQFGANSRCYVQMVNLLCFICSPDTGSWTKKIDDTKYSISVCQGYCDAAWDACKDIDWSKFNDPSHPAKPTNADEFCDVIFAQDESDETGQFQMSVSIVDATTGCFMGSPEKTIACSDCMTESKELCSEDGGGGSGGGFKLSKSHLLIALIALLGLAIIGGAVGLGIWLYKRSKSTPSRGRDYFPQLDEDTESLN
jgi:hypothetical protein